MSLPLDPQTLPIAATGFPAPIERHWDTLCRNNLGQLVDGNGVVVAVEAGAITGDGNGRFKTSVRVGSATALAGRDGNDGEVIASGPSAALIFGDRATPANYGLWFRDGSGLHLYSSEAGVVWTISVTTGQVVQAGLTAVAAGTNITLGIAGFAACGSRLVLPGGEVYGVVNLTASGAIAAGSVVATLAAGHRPPTTVGQPATKFTGGVLTSPVAAALLINGAGQVVTETALANTDTLVATLVFMTS